MSVTDRKPDEVLDITDWFDPPEVIDLTDLLKPEPALDITDLLFPAKENSAQLREDTPAKPERAIQLVRDTPSHFWDKPVAQSESHIDLRSIERTSRHAQDKLAAVLKGGPRTRIIRAIAKQAIEQIRSGKLPSQLTFEHDPELESLIADHAREVYQQARQQTKAEIARQLAGRRSHA
jgi:hypothetical protein